MPCNDKNPLIRDGCSRTNRVLAALSTGYAKVDEREQADLILFAGRYAEYLNYFNSSNAIDGDWRELMKMDVSVVLATLSGIQLRKISDYKKILYKRIKTAATDAEAKTEFKYLFDALFSLVELIDEQFQLLPDSYDYKINIREIIRNRLQQPLANLEKCFNDFKTASLLDYTLTELDGTAPLKVVSDPNFNRSQLSAEWNSAVPDLSLTLPAIADAKSKIIYIIQHNLFNSQLEQLINGIAALLVEAEGLFDQTLTDFPRHSPHYALFLAFVNLFRYLQDDLNRYTGRHLDFYYKDVLRLSNCKPEPDSAHLTFELQKPVTQCQLKKGRLFKGGKDVTGKEISYALTEDIVINKTSVSKIQSWQKTARSGRQVLIASPVANSEDGMGGKLTSPDKSWFTFGDVKKAQTAAIGFAIASNLLYLNEGTRSIIITFTFSDSSALSGFDTLYDTGCFSAELTGKKGWLKPETLSSQVSGGNQLIFSIGVSPTDPAIIPYTEKVHKENLDISLPMLKILFNQEKSGGIPLQELCTRTLASVTIHVSANDVRDLSLSNDQGRIDASKPFKPFGDFPAQGSSFYVGSKEIFQKPLKTVTFNSSPSDFKDDITQKLFLLSPESTEPSYPITQTAGSSQADFGTTFPRTIADFGPNEPMTALTREGFFRFKLQSTDYSLDTHLGMLKTALSKTTMTQSTSNGVTSYSMSIEAPPAPAELKLNEFSIDYVAEYTILFTSDDLTTDSHFYHFTPFGYYEVHPTLFEAGITAAETAERLTLIPNLTRAGELFLGLDQAVPDTVVTILFQVADGSSNPLQDMETVTWSYLTKNNNWKDFDKHQIIDSTKNFTQSGIITMTLPPDIGDGNTAHEKGLHWIRGSVSLHADAVCKMILIQAQAGKVQLVQDENDDIEFRQVLPAATITKLVESESAVKSITQPADSFEGKIREPDEHFYLRVSERLRHKQRAISLWDYEHIILEMFPEIYKVRCLNHTGFYEGSDADVFCENFPGHVTIIPVPDLRNKTRINPLKPYTPVRLLTNIQDYLSGLVTPFITLHVKNPCFEEIRLSFKVQFRENLDVSFHQQLLNQEIERFLCPWAWDSTREITFGGKINKSVLLNFVEEREYVDYVTYFRMDQILEREGSVIKNALIDIEEAVASTSRSVLVSYYDPDETDDTRKRHLIDTNITC